MDFPDDYAVIDTPQMNIIISMETYRRVRQDAVDGLRRTELVDIFNCEHIVNLEMMESMYTTTPATRELQREWNKLKNDELEQWEKDHSKSWE